jgi:hypothetical protein
MMEKKCNFVGLSWCKFGNTMDILDHHNKCNRLLGGDFVRAWTYGSRAPWSLFFKKIQKTGFKKFQKIETKILEVYNNWIY